MYLHSTFFTHEKQAPSPEISLRLQSFEIANPGCVTKVYSLDEARTEISAGLGREVVEAFDTLVPLTYKSDLARHCLLFLHAGAYSDVSLTHLRAPNLNDDWSVLIFRDATRQTATQMSTSLIYSRQPGHRIFELMIKAILANVKNRSYGLNSLSPTGPELWGRIIANNIAPADRVMVAESRLLSPSAYTPIGFFCPMLELLAVRSKSGDGLASIGGARESYNWYYNKRLAYKEVPSLVQKVKTLGARLTAKLE